LVPESFNQRNQQGIAGQAMSEHDYETMYCEGNTPWDHGSHDHNLADVIKTWSIEPCRVLDLGCGSGNNAIWLARNGFTVTGFDLAPTAIQQARRKAGKAGVEIIFQGGDFLERHVDGAPFDLVFDRGCLHSLPEAKDRALFAVNVSRHLADGGYWLSLIGNADGPEREIGPPRMTAAEIAAAIEPCFEILSLTSGVFGDDQEDPPRAWIAFMQKRG
jgi:2-polyprenyl-3-methyl-5-hydroxy-6-metoxy-1,4-benzoquinol methylase